jgi:hypothetical protein
MGTRGVGPRNLAPLDTRTFSIRHVDSPHRVCDNFRMGSTAHDAVHINVGRGVFEIPTSYNPLPTTKPSDQPLALEIVQAGTHMSLGVIISPVLLKYSTYIPRTQRGMGLLQRPSNCFRSFQCRPRFWFPTGFGNPDEKLGGTRWSEPPGEVSESGDLGSQLFDVVIKIPKSMENVVPFDRQIIQFPLRLGKKVSCIHNYSIAKTKQKSSSWNRDS